MGTLAVSYLCIWLNGGFETLSLRCLMDFWFDSLHYKYNKSFNSIFNLRLISFIYLHQIFFLIQFQFKQNTHQMHTICYRIFIYSSNQQNSISFRSLGFAHSTQMDFGGTQYSITGAPPKIPSSIFLKKSFKMFCSRIYWHSILTTTIFDNLKKKKTHSKYQKLFPRENKIIHEFPTKFAKPIFFRSLCIKKLNFWKRKNFKIKKPKSMNFFWSILIL